LEITCNALNFCAPSRYVQGRDATHSLGQEMAKTWFDWPGVCCCRQICKETSRSSPGIRHFKKAEIEYEIFEFAGECSREEIDRAKKAAQNFAAKAVVGAGGGKVLDTSRAVAAELDLPAINCPTAASSDAPCSALSVVYSEDGAVERYLFYKRNPDLVLVDTTVIAKAPPRLLTAGMGDALATWFEARTVMEARKANQVGVALPLVLQL
jgi:glycerol dehydrogenase